MELTEQLYSGYRVVARKSFQGDQQRLGEGASGQVLLGEGRSGLADGFGELTVCVHAEGKVARKTSMKV